MSSTQYTAVESEPIVTTEDPRDTLEDTAQLPLTVSPYIPQQTWAYLQYLIPLIAVLVFPLIFATYVYTKGRVPASQRIASLALSYPQVKGQVIAILATSLTATVRWVLGGSAALLARKRLLRPRPVYEINMFFSLRNISVIWDWKHRRRMFFLALFLAVVCGLLTSGFFTLLNPLPMEVYIQHPSAREVNFALESEHLLALFSDSGFGDVANGTDGVVNLLGSSGAWSVSSSTSDVPFMLQSMTRQDLASRDQQISHPVGGFMTTFKELEYTSFVGGTAGVHISGAARYRHPGDPVFPLGKPEGPSYSLDLQGFWIDVSCSMGTVPPLKITFDQNPATAHLGPSLMNYTFTCPGPSIAKQREVEYELEVVLALDCPLQGGTTAIMFYSLDRHSFPLVDNITCSVFPQIGDVNVVLNPDFQAFNVTRKGPLTPSLTPVARRFIDLVLENVLWTFRNIPVLAHTTQAQVGDSNDGGTQPAVLLELMEMILSAMFEFEASFVRGMLMKRLKERLDTTPTPTREVRVVLTERTVAWEVKWTTWLGLLPLVTVCIIAFTMIVMTYMSEGELTVFDPMSPVSLLAATSAGEVAFPNQTLCKSIGDPLDENVLVTKVSYEEKEKTWGLWSSDGSPEGIMNGSA